MNRKIIGKVSPLKWPARVWASLYVLALFAFPVYFNWVLLRGASSIRVCRTTRSAAACQDVSLSTQAGRAKPHR